MAYVIIRMRGNDVVQLWQSLMSKHSNTSATTTTNSTTCTPERISSTKSSANREWSEMPWNTFELDSTSEHNSCTQRVREKIWNKNETRARRCSIEQHVALRSRSFVNSLMCFSCAAFSPFFIIFDSVAIIECLIINNFSFSIAFPSERNERPGYVVFNAQMAGWRPRTLRHGHDSP